MFAGERMMQSNCLLPDNIKNRGPAADWRSWCRLCAKDDLVGNINVLFKDEQQPDEMLDMSLAAAIKKYFRINITREDTLPKMICTECFSLVTSLVNFSERITKVQHMFCACALKNEAECTESTLHATRLEFGLLDADREHVIAQPLPEVQFFERKHKINGLEENPIETETINLNPLAQRQIKIGIKEEKSPEVLIYKQESIEVDVKDPFLSEEDEDYVLSSAHEYNSSSEDATNLQMKVEHAEGKNPQVSKLTATENTKIIADNVLKKRKRLRRLCKLTFTEIAKQSENENESNSDENFACVECPRRFKSLQQFKEHLKRAHTKIIEKKCTQCTSTFSTYYQLKKHTKQQHPLAEKVLPSQAKKNMDERPFVCEECGTTVRTKRGLKSHMLTHTDYAPFKCEVCQKCFKEKRALTQHLEIHSPTKHTCTQCGLQLNSRPTFNRHMLVHSDKLTHICDYCGRAFKRGKTLRLHRFLHTGKPYSCEFCDRSFANASNWRSHRRKSHPEELAALEVEKPFTCNKPDLHTLKADTKTTNIVAIVAKQSSNSDKDGSPPTNNCEVARSNLN